MDKQNKFYEKWWFWIIIGLVIIFSIGMITTDPPQETDSSGFDYKATEQGEYSQAMENMYMEECVIKPGMENYCQCSWDYLTDELTIEEFIDMSFEMDKTGEMPDVMNKAINECFDKIEY